VGNVSIDINRENTHIFGIYNNPLNKNGLMWDMKIDGHSKVAMYGAIKPRDQTIC
jgi:hypothetical protein